MGRGSARGVRHQAMPRQQQLGVDAWATSAPRRCRVERERDGSRARSRVQGSRDPRRRARPAHANSIYHQPCGWARRCWICWPEQGLPLPAPSHSLPPMGSTAQPAADGAPQHHHALLASLLPAVRTLQAGLVSRRPMGAVAHPCKYLPHPPSRHTPPSARTHARGDEGVARLCMHGCVRGSRARTCAQALRVHIRMLRERALACVHA